ncbi:thioredoxin family protein [Microbulbifer rhizosphaerae]|uniref:Thiol-disulfide isomerase/thioredoxin n=1 Tax=Microbulbifer rhizosphaerae TaxID=1562603 RepID=A0A7W4Z7M4_9GAMM|nr:thioredoxin family protein [Microbulbifer rhizosphaerae]MBB3059908.1 thiol-disulfide isomerase/thioredoxin [Microbulbifer rhizosphaerae]
MKQLIAALLLLPGLVAGAVAAEEPSAEVNKESFSKERFEALKAAGQVVLVDVYAGWCPTCAKQQEVIQQYREDNPGKEFHVLEVDFDKDKQWVRHFRAPRQSTLLLYAGEQQMWFGVAETRPDVIAAELDKALAAAAEGGS